MSKQAMLQNNFDAGARQDEARDRPVAGASWRMIDWILAYGAPARGRGGWANYSNALSAQTATAGYVAGGVFAQFSLSSGTEDPQNLAVDEDGTLHKVSAGAGTVVGATRVLLQNPVFHGGAAVSGTTADTAAHFTGLVIFPDGTGANVPKKYNGVAISDLNGSPPKARYATVYKNYTVLGNGTATISTSAATTTDYYPNRIWFSQQGDPDCGFSGTAGSAWDTLDSWIDFSLPVVGMGSTKNALLIFHDGQMTRIRGSNPPPAEDMEVDDPFLSIGLLDPHSITEYKDNLYWCAPEGVFRTDGVVLDDLTNKGGRLREWITLTSQATTAWTFATGVIRDHLIVSVMNGVTAVSAFMVDLQNYVWTDLSNVDARAMWDGRVNEAYELFWGRRNQAIVARFDTIYSVGSSAYKNDGNGTAVTPVLETSYLGGDDPGLKRFRRLFIGYELDDYASDNPTVAVSVLGSPEGTSYTAVGTLTENTTYHRVALPLNLRSPGISLKLAQANAGDFHLHDISVETTPQEQSKRA